MRTASGNARWSSSGIGELGPIAVARTDRFGEPAQLAPTACPALDPLAVMPPRCKPGQRPVVLAGARRAGRSVHRDMDLVGRRELRGEVTGDQTGKPRRHRGADDERRVRLAKRVVESQQLVRVVEQITNGHDGHADLSQRRRRQRVFARDRQDDDVALRQGRRQRIRGRIAEIAHDRTAIVQQSRDPTADDAVADDSGAQPRSGSSSWRHPPCWGGVPPLPRTRNAAAMAAASASAASTLLRTLTRGALLSQHEPKGTGSSSAKHVISNAFRQAAATATVRGLDTPGSTVSCTSCDACWFSNRAPPSALGAGKGLLKSTVRTADDVG